MRNLRVSTKLMLIIGASVSLALATTFLQLYRQAVQSANWRALLANQVHQRELARKVQVHFKLQVQEWKNVLLRGHDPKDLQKYKKQMLQQEEIVRKTAHEMQSEITDAELLALVADFEKGHAKYNQSIQQALAVFEGSNGNDPKAADKLAKGQDRAPNEVIDRLADQLGQRVAEFTAAQESAVAKERWLIGTVSCLISLVVLGLALFLSRGISRPLIKTVEVLEEVAKGDLTKQVEVNGKDEIGRIAVALNAAIVSLREAAERQKKQLEQATAMARQGAMLESMTASITYADRDGKITYANPAALQMFKKIETHLPVRTEQLVGQSIDIFHKNPTHQRRIISNPNNLPYRGQVTIGGETFELVVSAIFDQNKEYIGNLVSWDCVTEKLAKDRQIQENNDREKQVADELRAKVDSILGNVNEAASGDLTQVVQVSGEDAIGRMGAGLDKLLQNLRGSISSIAQNSTALAGSSEELSSVSTQMSANAEETSAQSGVVSAAAEQVSKNVQTVATAVEEMSASIKEIAKNAGEGAKIASNAVQ
ncbi:MAG: HAMP domain-containing protein, partial [Planctomycetes bacterium]|nr:HAMP domain-containing protein [Planctomycetota bacterium]